MKLSRQSKFNWKIEKKLKKINNFKIFENFLSQEEKSEILDFIFNLEISLDDIRNVHINEVASYLNGEAFMFDLSQTKVSNYLSTFQSSDQVFDNKILPKIFFDLIVRISTTVNLSLDNAFLQIIKMKKGGKIKKHYDTSYPGHINYKCNISLVSEDYVLFTSGKNLDVKENDLYCFEASLYSHWTTEFNQDRILLSYGFGLPYQTLDRKENEPIVRLSNRIFKYFQS